MYSIDDLTTERLRKKFQNNFNLCNFSIQIARGLIRAVAPATLQDILVAVDQRSDEPSIDATLS